MPNPNLAISLGSPSFQHKKRKVPHLIEGKLAGNAIDHNLGCDKQKGFSNRIAPSSVRGLPFCSSRLKKSSWQLVLKGGSSDER
jgi:hypothetical protein